MSALVFLILLLGGVSPDVTVSAAYTVVDTAQTATYNAASPLTPAPTVGQAFYGQDAQYNGFAPSYVKNADGTISDKVTGLMWTPDPGSRISWSSATTAAVTYAGYQDWRVPTIKELYSLILFSGTQPEPTGTRKPFIDTNYFVFTYGTSPFRDIDAQYVTKTEYVDSAASGMAQWFGVNFADGRIKGYGKGGSAGIAASFYALYVRGPTYGVNAYVDQQDGTVLDTATGLAWQKADSGYGMNWQSALSYCENLVVAGYTDWRLPNAKELQSIVDYTRSPGTTNSAALDPVFQATGITNEAGKADYPFYWTATTHLSGSSNATMAVYVAFGRAMGKMNGVWMDVHGAGAQRSDPKSGNPSGWPDGYGPQGDAIRINNYVRCVRSSSTSAQIAGVMAAGGPSTIPELSASPWSDTCPEVHSHYPAAAWESTMPTCGLEAIMTLVQDYGCTITDEACHVIECAKPLPGVIRQQLANGCA